MNKSAEPLCGPVDGTTEGGCVLSGVVSCAHASPCLLLHIDRVDAPPAALRVLSELLLS